MKELINISFYYFSIKIKHYGLFLIHLSSQRRVILSLFLLHLQKLSINNSIEAATTMIFTLKQKLISKELASTRPQVSQWHLAESPEINQIVICLKLSMLVKANSLWQLSPG